MASVAEWPAWSRDIAMDGDGFLGVCGKVALLASVEAKVVSGLAQSICAMAGLAADSLWGHHTGLSS